MSLRFKLVKEYVRDGVNIKEYAPSTPIFVMSFDPVRRQPVRKRILRFSVHDPLVFYSITLPDETQLIVSEDHSLFMYDTKEDCYVRISPLQLKDNKERYCFIKVLNDTEYEYIPAEDCVIEFFGKDKGYDLTIEDTKVFCIDNGYVVYDTMAVYAPLTKEAQENMERMTDPKLQFHPGKFRVMGIDNELASAIYLITKDEPSEDIELEFESLKDVMEYVVNPAKLFEAGKTVYIKRFKFKTTLGRAFLSALFGARIQQPIIKSKLASHLTNLFINLVIEKGDYKLYVQKIQLLYRTAAKIANQITTTLMDLYDEEIEPIIKEAKEKLQNTHNPSDFAEILKEYTNRITSILPRYELSYKTGTKLHKTVPQMLIARGFVTDIVGNIHGPILTSYLDGLTDLDTFKSAYGSRKGLVDKTQNVSSSGYLLRKLIFAVQSEDMYIDKPQRPAFCGTNKLLKYTLESPSELESRFLLRYIRYKGQEYFLDYITIKHLSKEIKPGDEIEVYSPIYCKEPKFCRKCLPDYYLYVSPFIGIVSAQALCEDLTQSLLRTFHTGGSAEKGFSHKHFILENDILQNTVPIEVVNVTKEEDEFTLEYTVSNSADVYTLTLNIDESAEIFVELGARNIKLPPNTQILKLTQETGDYKRLTKIVEHAFQAKNEYLTPEELYEPLKYVNCQSLYKEILVQHFFYDADDMTQKARLNGYENYVKIPLFTLLRNKYVLSLAFGYPQQFIARLALGEELQSFEELIEKELESSPLAAFCLWDIDALESFLKTDTDIDFENIDPEELL